MLTQEVAVSIIKSKFKFLFEYLIKINEIEKENSS